jgi:hypothetical protein
MRDTLKKFFTSTAEHHIAMAKAHQLAMDGCEEGDGQHEFHKSAMASHAAQGEACCECAKACSKAADSDFEKLVPMNISRVTPTPPGITAVPRAGSRPMPTASVEKEFEGLVKIETGQEIQ